MLLDVAFQNLFLSTSVCFVLFYQRAALYSVLLDETEIVSEEENGETKQRNCQQE